MAIDDIEYVADVCDASNIIAAKGSLPFEGGLPPPERPSPLGPPPAPPPPPPPPINPPFIPPFIEPEEPKIFAPQPNFPIGLEITQRPPIIVPIDPQPPPLPPPAPAPFVAGPTQLDLNTCNLLSCDFEGKKNEGTEKPTRSSL